MKAAAKKKGAAAKTAPKAKAAARKRTANQVMGIEVEGHRFTGPGAKDRFKALATALQQVLEQKSGDLAAAVGAEPMSGLGTSPLRVLSVKSVKPGQSSAGF